MAPYMESQEERDAFRRCLVYHCLKWRGFCRKYNTACKDMRDRVRYQKFRALLKQHKGGA